ncbi:L,D-transpeptidase family protein [Sandarakinorhabdus sp.]|uniref:L,D-transpeptidase family protein n=1 Tax=Sandarakinorhabdus sp. TaxID=1916663 RepID=UPI00286D7BE4|nr:L,D-transpeptidase family protein [Sandarakinorhabdus sp.]
MKPLLAIAMLVMAATPVQAQATPVQAQAPPAQAQAPPVQAQAPPHWDAATIVRLRQWADFAGADALPVPDLTALDAALRSADAAGIDEAATRAALALAKAHLLGTAAASDPARWHMDDSDRTIDLGAGLSAALALGEDGLDSFFGGLRPQHPDYAALALALSLETDPGRRQTLARNMERWRWLPRSLGPDFVLVNVAAFEARLWKQGQQRGTWRVIVGKTRTPTPVFAASIAGVILNPWWEIPASIVAENHGRFPASKGYVRAGDRWRQKPGPDNALGQVKLDMPNPHSVYLHDTPAKPLFERDVRAFSHGCVRVGDAMGLAKTLVEDVRSAADIDAIVASGETVTVPLSGALPVYITYFTAGVDAQGKVLMHRDIYRRDRVAGNIAGPVSLASANMVSRCPA